MGTIFSNKWDYELAFLPWWSCRTECRGYTTCCLGPESDRSVCTEFPRQVKPLALLCRQGKPWAVLSVQVSLYIGLLNGLCRFPSALIRFLSWTG